MEFFPATDVFYWCKNFIRSIMLTQRSHATAVLKPIKVGNIVMALRRITMQLYAIHFDDFIFNSEI